jgi:hypothetical protein
MSAIVPGAGQLVLGQERFAGYMAVESYGWIRYLRHRADGRRSRESYRTLAAQVARSVFVEDPPLGAFEYYERMEQFIESGVFDMSDDPDLQPDMDESTYNGSLWRRARETFWDDPGMQPAPTSNAYIRSVQYYRDRAVTDEYRWSWRNSQLEQDLYRRTIAGSNRAFRSSIADLGVIIGNHVLSMVDAFVALRLRGAVGEGDGGGSVYWISGRIPLPIRAP